MPKKSIIKELLNRRIPQILGSYFIAGATAIFFIDWLVNRYNFPDYYVSLCLFGLIAIIPTVCVISYFHGAPGKDEWTIIEKTIIPINIIFIIIILLVGYKYEIWLYGFEEESQNFIVHVSTSKEHIDDLYWDNHLSNKDMYLFREVENSILYRMQNSIVAKLNEEYFGSEIIIEAAATPKIKELFNQIPHFRSSHSQDSEINIINEELKSEIYKTYNFESENEIIVYIYEVYSKGNKKVPLGYFQQIQYMKDFQNISNICSQSIYNDKALIAHIVGKLSGEIYGTAIGDKNLGRIIEILEKDLVKIQFNKELTLKKGMTLVSPAKYYWQRDGLQRRMEDYEMAMDYINTHPKYLEQDDENGLTAEKKQGFYGEDSHLKKDYSYALEVMSKWEGKTQRAGVSIWNTIYYKMKILDINEKEGTLVAKVTYKYPPWVKVRTQDKIYIKGAFDIN